MKPGDKLVCIKKFKGVNRAGMKTDTELPVLYKTYTYDGNSPNDGYIYLVELNYFLWIGRAAFNATHFVPLDHWKQAEYMVEELKEELEVTV